MHPSYRPITVGISGGSASGKSTFARAMADALSEFNPVILNQDRYFRDWAEFPPDEREEVRTSNHPRAVLWTELIGHIEGLAARRSVQVPVVGTRARNRGDLPQMVEPGDVLIVEGHLLFWNEELRGLMEIKKRLDELAERFGDRFKTAPLLEEIADHGGHFYHQDAA